MELVIRKLYQWSMGRRSCGRLNSLLSTFSVAASEGEMSVSFAISRSSRLTASDTSGVHSPCLVMLSECP